MNLVRIPVVVVEGATEGSAKELVTEVVVLAPVSSSFT